MHAPKVTYICKVFSKLYINICVVVWYSYAGIRGRPRIYTWKFVILPQKILVPPSTPHTKQKELSQTNQQTFLIAANSLRRFSISTSPALFVISTSKCRPPCSLAALIAASSALLLSASCSAALFPVSTVRWSACSRACGKVQTHTHACVRAYMRTCPRMQTSEHQSREGMETTRNTSSKSQNGSSFFDAVYSTLSCCLICMNQSAQNLNFYEIKILLIFYQSTCFIAASSALLFAASASAAEVEADVSTAS